METARLGKARAGGGRFLSVSLQGRAMTVGRNRDNNGFGRNVFG